jgi:membrane protease YdiL (CAAX protease family)
MIKDNKLALAYSIITLLLTFIIGQMLLILYPNGNTMGSSILFILMNLIPMIVAIVFSKYEKKKKVLKDMFFLKEKITPYILAICSVALYYGISFLLGNIEFTNGTIFMLLSYIPWTILQGGLEECGWRWYLQEKLKINSFTIKMFVISLVWFLWHIPIYRLPWITAGSSNYFVFYLMILGNTFMFGTIKEKSRGTLPCIIAHMLIDSFAVLMLVQNNLLSIIILVIIEITLSIFVNKKILN